MIRNTLSLLLASLVIVGCSAKDDKAALRKDTALARDLSEASVDTSMYSEAADLAMRDIPDSELAPATSRQPSTRPTSSSAASAMRSTRIEIAPSPAAPAPPVRTPAAQPVAPQPSVAQAAPVQPRVAAQPAPQPRATQPAQTPQPVPTRQTADAPRPTGCDSPASADQRNCLLGYLSRSDQGLDRTYQSLIAELRAHPQSDGKGPATVEQLRVAQRAWLVYRDTECRRRNRGQEGPLWAPTRARCLGEFSQVREQELAAQLKRVSGTE